MATRTAVVEIEHCFSDEGVLLSQLKEKLGDRSMRVVSKDVFSPHWPEKLESRKFYEIPCDDDGRLFDASMSVMIAEDGDVHVSMSKFSDDPRDPRSKAKMDPLPSIRIRAMQGGGRNLRTRQALLWLAEAIRLDNIDNPQNEARHNPLASNVTDVRISE